MAIKWPDLNLPAINLWTVWHIELKDNKEFTNICNGKKQDKKCMDMNYKNHDLDEDSE